MPRPLHGLVLTLCLLGAPAPAQAIIELRHAHGIGYSADGNRILISNHYGIAVYSDGRWSKVEGPGHDYMGFVVTRDFIFSSGHVAGSRGTANPLGLVRSADGGQSWTTLALAGQTEFHFVAAGYESNTVYVYSERANAVMPGAGIYRMAGDRLIGWQAAAGRGLEGEVATITAHPREAGTVVVATTSGLFISRDSGNEFEPLVAGARITTARFMLDGETLLVGTLEGQRAGLHRVTLKDGKRQTLALPPFGRDAVASIVQNPARRAELALISFERAVYVSPDAGKTWKRIARPRGTLPGS